MPAGVGYGAKSLIRNLLGGGADVAAARAGADNIPGFVQSPSGIYMPDPTRVRKAPRSTEKASEIVSRAEAKRSSPAIQVQTGPNRPGNRMANFFEEMQFNASYQHKQDIAKKMIPADSPAPVVGPKLVDAPAKKVAAKTMYDKPIGPEQPKMGEMGEMGIMSMIGGTIGMGMIGGGVSYATGGEFGQGFVAGAAGGFAARGLKRMALNNQAPGGGLTMTKKYANASFSGTSDVDGARGVLGSVLNSTATSLQTMKARNLMMGGAGLSGFAFGGKREKNHRRGFNQSRGSRF